MYKILVIDGGGVKGIFAAKLLLNIAKANPNFLSQVDMVAGSSIGGVIALAIAYGTPVQDIVQLLEDNFPDIFDDSWYDDFKDMGNLLGAEYSTTNMKKIVEAHFSNTTLGQLQKTVLVPTLDLDNESTEASKRRWKSKFYNNIQGQDDNEKVSDICLRATAAPTYFPTYQGCVDGGLIINNPSMAAVCQALDDDTLNKNIDDIVLLSVGTGINPAYVSGDNLDWGIANWAKLLIPLVLDTTVDVADYQCKKILKGRYHRIDKSFSNPVALDNYKKISQLKQEADSLDLTNTNTWISNNWI